ncbi:MAG: hypothetical protein J4428_03370 [Candidatus Aenigmarchaeota archaeon]|nr:hypothetical protein [Candidatus Aenigmarchaeota archaeon]
MESKLIKEWVSKGLSISRDFDLFSKRDFALVAKMKGQDPIVEYECPKCKFYEVKNIELKRNKSGKKFLEPKFNCSKCNEKIVVEKLKKK